MNYPLFHLGIFATLALPAFLSSAPLVYEGTDGPGKGKHIVLLAGDEEYRSEQSMPMLARILAFRHGFKTTVLFSVNEAGEIDPTNQQSLDHPEALDSADALMINLRFRQWPDGAMVKFVAALDRGVPLVALRTSTHAFNFPAKSESAYRNYSFNSKEWPGGFGRQILGETWISHHGAHKVEGTRSVVEAGRENHPILRGVQTIFGDSDVYTANPPPDAAILLRGQVTQTLDKNSPAVEGPKNNPMQPIAWTREVPRPNGKVNRVFTTTMGAATDLADPNLRRLVINGLYWSLGWEDKIDGQSPVRTVGPFKPLPYQFKGFETGLKPGDLSLDAAGAAVLDAGENSSEVKPQPAPQPPA